jgi:hypothetical protein
MAHHARAQLDRDAALVRLRRTRRWVLAGAAAVTAGIAALVSAVAPGRSLGAGAHSRGQAPSLRTSSTTPALPPPAGAAQLGLAGPGEAPAPVPDQSQGAPGSSGSSAAPNPAPAPQQPAAVSGGS